MEADSTPLDPGPSQWATFLDAYGRLVSLGVERKAALEVLSQEGPLSLRNLAGGLAGCADDGAREAALEAAGVATPGWLSPLLQAEPRGPGLLEAAALLRREGAHPWRPGWTWARLKALEAGGARPGDGLGALAHDARRHGRKGLAEVLNSAARRARQGDALAAALAGASGYTRVERLVIDRLQQVGLEAVLSALEALAELQQVEAAPSAAAPARDEDPLVRLAEAASVGKRGLERVLTGLGGMLGIDRETERVHAKQVARETVAKRTTPEDDPEASPPEPAAPAAPARRKTIGGDSGPVRVNELHAPEALGGGGAAGQEAWLTALEEARARMTLLEIQPTEAGLAQQVRRELETLKREARGLGLEADHLQTLAELRTRFDAWRKLHGEP